MANDHLAEVERIMARMAELGPIDMAAAAIAMAVVERGPLTVTQRVEVDALRRRLAVAFTHDYLSGCPEKMLRHVRSSYFFGISMLSPNLTIRMPL